jgi:hypothetical protein
VKPSRMPAAEHPFLAGSSLFSEEGAEMNPVASLASVGFEAYAKVFAPLYAFDPVPPAWETKTWADLGAGFFPGMEDYPEMLDSHVNYMVVPSGEKGFTLARVPLQEIFTTLGLKWDATASIEELLLAVESRSLPAELFGPDEGHLDKGLLENLLPVLMSHTGFSTGLFHYDALRCGTDEEGNVLGNANDLFKGSLLELTGAIAPEGYTQSTPCLFWPEDGAWFVFTDYDLTYSIVGGSKALVKALTTHPNIDAVAVTGETPLVALRGNPDKKGLLFDAFPSPHGVGPLDPVKWRKALLGKV